MDQQDYTSKVPGGPGPHSRVPSIALKDIAILGQIADFAGKAHSRQFRKYSSEKYIVHPMAVMNLCSRVTADNCILAAALLHDVLEDTTTSTSEIRQFLNPLMEYQQVERTIGIVIELTDVYIAAKYPGMNRRARKTKELERMEQISPDAQTIKYADILDNCRQIITDDRDFAPVYLAECAAILRALKAGNAYLRNEATLLVQGALDSLAK